MDSKLSRRGIASFVEKNKIQLSDYEDREFVSYNDFFTRKIKPGIRAVDMEPSHFISPCDSKLTIYSIDSQSVFPIKDSLYRVADLLDGADVGQSYQGGYCMVFRLAVDDYHRYCYVDNGRKGDNTFISGKLHTVQPIALEQYNIYKQNSREYTILETENFGKIIQIEVGAMMVGRIVNHHGACQFQRGEEKGMFEFGGSTIVLLVEKDRVRPFREILDRSAENVETAVKFGQQIGERYDG